MKLAGPVVAAVSEIVYVLLIVIAVLAGAGAVSVVGVVLGRWRHPRPIAARAVRGPKPVRVAHDLPEPQRPAIERPGGLHLHVHGISADDVAAIVALRDPPRPGVNRPDPPRVP